MFKKSKYIHTTYDDQGLIHFICVNARKLCFDNVLIKYCTVIAEEDAAALYECVTNDKITVDAVARKHYINEKKLYKHRKRFYENWKSYFDIKLIAKKREQS